MSWAVTGPIPSIVSSSSTVAVPRLIGPLSRGPHRAAPTATPPGRRLCRDDHLLTVGEARGEVDRLRLGPAGRASGALHGVVDARSRRAACRRPAPDRARDIDDHVPAAVRVDAERARIRTTPAPTSS